MMDYSTIISIGSGTPVLGVVSGLHGNEDVSSELQSFIKRLTFTGKVILIKAHLRAIEEHVRFVETDLNRSFPGRIDGSLEERIAFQLLPVLDQCDFLIDIHSFYSESPPFTVIPKVNDETIALSFATEIVHNVIFPGKNASLCEHTRCGVGVEIGSIYDKERVAVGFDVIESVMSYLGMKRRESIRERAKQECYRVVCSIAKPEGFVAHEALGNFKLVKRGDVLGLLNGETVYSELDFYPLLLNTPVYNDVLCYACVKEG